MRQAVFVACQAGRVLPALANRCPQLQDGAPKVPGSFCGMQGSQRAACPSSHSLQSQSWAALLTPRSGPLGMMQSVPWQPASMQPMLLVTLESSILKLMVMRVGALSSPVARSICDMQGWQCAVCLPGHCPPFAILCCSADTSRRKLKYKAMGAPCRQAARHCNAHAAGGLTLESSTF